MSRASTAAAVRRYFFASSACVYAAEKQVTSEVTALTESDAYPAMPEDGYGWEKLFGERMCRHFAEDFGLEVRIARYHNVYGPNGTYAGGREKAPAAICRKVAEAKLSGRHEIEIWGDGEQTRSFTYIDDAIEGTLRLMASDVAEPLNVGSSELVTVNGLVDLIEGIEGLTLERRYDLDAPQGVRGRNSDNTLIQERLGWQPSTPLRAGLECTYDWIWSQLTEPMGVRLWRLEIALCPRYRRSCVESANRFSECTLRCANESAVSARITSCVVLPSGICYSNIVTPATVGRPKEQ